MIWRQISTYFRNFLKESAGLPTEPAAPPFRARRGKLHHHRDLAWTLLLSLILLPAMLHAQAREKQGPNPAGGAHPNPPAEGAHPNPSEGGAQQAPPAGPEEPNRQAGGNAQQHPPPPGAIFRRLRELPPAQQKHIMENNPQFQRLLPEDQESVRERLQQWNAMTPQEKDSFRQRENIDLQAG